MAKRVSFSVTAQTAAPTSRVFELLRSGSTWPSWTPIGSFRLESEGTEGGESVGAVRQFSTGGVKSRERLLELSPPSRLSYTAISGLPIRDHRADVMLDEKDGVTEITWHEEFDTKIPGTRWFFAWFVRNFMKRCVDGLARHAAR
jgi:uncharacterized protein YndB with AHSA1/START domain